MGITAKLDGVAVTTQANVYFDGKCVSHSVQFADGTDKHWSGYRDEAINALVQKAA